MRQQLASVMLGEEAAKAGEDQWLRDEGTRACSFSGGLRYWIRGRVGDAAPWREKLVASVGLTHGLKERFARETRTNGATSFVDWRGRDGEAAAGVEDTCGFVD